MNGLLENEENEVKFRLQRRNLITSSIITTFYNWGDINLPKINIFGNEIILNDPKSLMWILYISFIYLFWRYCTILYDVSAYSRYKTAVTERFNLYAIMTKKIMAIYNYKKGSFTIEVFHEDMHIRPIYKRRYWVSSLNGNRIQNSELHGISKLEIFFRKIVYFLKISIQTSMFSDYIVPLILALATAFSIYMKHTS